MEHGLTRVLDRTVAYVLEAVKTIDDVAIIPFFWLAESMNAVQERRLYFHCGKNFAKRVFGDVERSPGVGLM
jgi:hypothetical protein